MKKTLKCLGIAILFFIVSYNFALEAKKSCMSRVESDCKGGCEWRHRKCRNKVKKQSNSNILKTTVIGMNTLQAPTNFVALNNQIPVNQIFVPVNQFGGINWMGYYDKQNQRAQIFNPSEKNGRVYLFNNVRAVANTGVLKKGTFIGSFDTPNWTLPAPGIIGYKLKTTELYGDIVQ